MALTQVKTKILLWYNTFVQAKMVIPLWYTIIAGSMIATWLVFRFGYRLVKCTWLRTSYVFILKNLMYPHLFKRLLFMGAITRFKAIMVILYLSETSYILSYPRHQGQKLAHVLLSCPQSTSFHFSVAHGSLWHQRCWVSRSAPILEFISG